MPRRVALTRTLTTPLAAALLLGTACGPGSDDDDRPAPAGPIATTPTTADPTTTMTPEAQDEADVRQLFEDWYAHIDAVYEGGAGAPEVTDFLTGEYQRQVEVLIEERRAGTETYQRLPGSRLVIETVTISAGTATVTTCLFEVAGRRPSATAEQTESSNTYRLETEAVRTDDGWRLSDQHQIGTTEDGDRCPDA